MLSAARNDGESTPAYLARVLEEDLGFSAMAQRALAGDFTSRLVDVGGYPVVVGDGVARLMRELAGKTAIVHKTERPAVRAVMQAVANGEFDGTTDEHQSWAETDDGQAVITDVLRARLGAL